MAGKKLESNFRNMVLVLFGVTLISSFSLSFVYNQTKDIIAKAQKEKQLKAIKEVILDGHDNMPSEESFQLLAHDQTPLQCYPAKEGEKITSVAIRTVSKKGFSGDIVLMVGFLEDGTINKISVVKQTETPGLGTKILLPSFQGQFEGKHPDHLKLKVKKDGGDIDAITAATITSRAFCDAVEKAYTAYKKHQSEN